MTRDIPMRQKKPKKRIEEEHTTRAATAEQLPAPKAEPAFQEGWRECVEQYALHAPNRRGVARILDDACLVLEEECLRRPTRESYARYEGYRAAMKELRRQRLIR